MNLLFIHQNFPAQYVHLLHYFAVQKTHRIIFLTQRKEGRMPYVDKRVYAPAREPTEGIHHYVRDLEAHVLNAQGVLRAAYELKRKGFVPDLILGHNGWGEIWYLKEVFPKAPLIGYFEFFYHLYQGFEKEIPHTKDRAPSLFTKNAGNLLGLAAADFGQTPTCWQQSTYPQIYRPKIKVLHEGIDTALACPDPMAFFDIAGKEGTDARRFQAGDEVLTYVARNLEPHRGFHQMMRSLPRILNARPKAHVLIVGGNEVSYGAKPPKGETYRSLLLKEVGDALDLSRVHFLGKLPYLNYLKVLKVSAAHVYLTYPFVLSWSMLEAMSAGCLLIASHTAPVTEVVCDRENGLLVDFFNTSAIADRVIDALQNGQDYLRLRAAARATILEGYDLKTRALPAYVRWLDAILKA